MRAERSVALSQELTRARMETRRMAWHLSSILPRRSELQNAPRKAPQGQTPQVRSKAGLCNGHTGLCHPSLGTLGAGKRELCWLRHSHPTLSGRYADVMVSVASTSSKRAQAPAALWSGERQYQSVVS